MSKMVNFRRVTNKRSGCAGGKFMSTVGILVLLLSVVFFLSACVEGDDRGGRCQTGAGR